jgi:hypothetical protein
VSSLADFNVLLETIKQGGKRATDATYPAAVMFGVVQSTNPLEINVEQKMTLESAQLILTRNVTDFTMEMTVDHWTEDETTHFHAVQDTYTGGGTSSPTEHKHAYKGRKSFLVHNALLVGEKVVLLRVQGGQKFVVIDRLG